MSMIEHPEELIDRAMHGALDARERSDLNHHLATCEACAGLLTLAPRFERDLAAQPQDELLDRRAVEAAMQKMQRSVPVGRSLAWPRWLRSAAAGVLLASGVTATAAILGRRISSRGPVESPELRPAEPPSGHSAPRSVAPPLEVPAPPEQPRPSELAPRSSPLRPAVTAAALFERAGKLRREGHADEAIAVYRRLQETYPGARGPSCRSRSPANCFSSEDGRRTH